MTLYEVLGVAPGSSGAEIHAAYVRLAREHHPDLQAGRSVDARASADRRMREVNDAWAVLGDEHRRRDYDRGLGVRTVIDEGDTFRPFDTGGEAEEERRFDDDATPLGPTSVGRRRAALVPVVLLVLAGLSVGAALLLRYDRLIAVGVVLGAVGAASFLVLPLLALSEASRHDR